MHDNYTTSVHKNDFEMTTNSNPNRLSSYTLSIKFTTSQKELPIQLTKVFCNKMLYCNHHNAHVHL